jgi:hypothetical protein
MAALLLSVIFPLLGLALLSGLAGFVWLAVLGEWKMLALGFGASVLGTCAVGIALLPKLLLAIPMMAMAK